MATQAIKCGDKAKDKISGIVGIVTCRAEFLYGCVRLELQPQEIKDGNPVKSFGIDEAQCELVEAGAIQGWAALDSAAESPAGDRDSDAMSRPEAPSR